MVTKKWLVCIIICILIIPSILLHASAQLGEDDNDPPSLIEKLLEARFKLGTKQGIGRWFVFQPRPPSPIQAYPDAVNLKYLNETTIIIGGIDPKTGDWAVLINMAGGWDWAWSAQSTSYTFEFVTPENASEDVWIANFDPKIITMSPNKENMDWPGALTPFKTNLTLTLKPSADPSYPTQDVTLKVDIIREEVFNPLTFLSPPTYPKTCREEYMEKTEDQSIRWWDTPSDYLMYKLMTGWSLVLLNIRVPRYERRVDSTVEFLIKVEKDHKAQIIAPPPVEIEPYQVLSIPVTIRNLGSHTDTFNFRANSTDKYMIVSAPPVITLKPGEESQALIGVAAPKVFQSVGSTCTIKLEAYSIDDPEKVFQNTIILTTKGIHVSGGYIYYSVLILTILVIIAVSLLFFLRRRRAKVCQKPDKPWEIPEEKKHLEQLKKTNKEEYNNVLNMMEDEYKSSLLWYKDYCKVMLSKARQKKKPTDVFSDIKNGLSNATKRVVHIFKRPKKRIKKPVKAEPKKPLRKEITEVQKTEEVQPTEISEEEQKPAVDLAAEREKRRREQAILRIKRAQEKQRRKVKRSAY